MNGQKMSKKYIIELDEDPHNIRLIQLKNGGDGVPITEFKVVCPYKEPDLEQIIDDAYTKGHDVGYKVGHTVGLADAWDACKKIIDMDPDTSEKVFGHWYTKEVMQTHTATTAIEKLKVYEQEKAAEIKIADEVETESGTRACVINPCSHSSQILVLVNPGDDQQTSAWWDKTAIKKTGKTYFEFLSVLKAIKQKKEEEKK